MKKTKETIPRDKNGRLNGRVIKEHSHIADFRSGGYHGLRKFFYYNSTQYIAEFFISGIQEGESVINLKK